MNDFPPPRKRWPLIIVAVVGVLAALYAGAWVGTAEVMKREIAQFLDAQRAGGNTIATGTLRAAGFPGRVRVIVPDIAVTAPPGGTDRSWRTTKITVSASPLRWRALDVDLGGRHQVVGLFAAKGVSVWIDTTQAHGRINLDVRGRVRHGDLDIGGLDARLTEGAAPMLHIGRAQANLELGEAAPVGAHPATAPMTAQLRLELTEVTGPKLVPQQMTTPIARVVLAMEIAGRIPSGPLPEVLEAWRADGGTLEVRELVLDWPPLRLDGNATVALDPKLQPMGSASLRLQGGTEVLDLLAHSGTVNESEASLARSAIALMSKRNAQGNQELTLPLMLQDRQLSVGPFAVSGLAPIVWPRIVVP